VFTASRSFKYLPYHITIFSEQTPRFLALLSRRGGRLARASGRNEMAQPRMAPVTSPEPRPWTNRELLRPLPDSRSVTKRAPDNTARASIHARSSGRRIMRVTPSSGSLVQDAATGPSPPHFSPPPQCGAHESSQRTANRPVCGTARTISSTPAHLTTIAYVIRGVFRSALAYVAAS
jgi:hypothetical protein